MTDVRGAPKGRVLVVIRQFFPLAAGAETQALRQAKSYIALGYDARVVTARYDRSLPSRDTVEGVPVIRLATANVRVLGSLVFLADLAAYLIFNAFRYDAVLVFHLKQAAAVTAILGDILGKRVVISNQAAGAFGDIEALRNARFGRLVLWCCRRARLFISGSSDITEELVGAGVPAEKIRFIPNGIPTEAFAAPRDKSAARAALGIPQAAFVVVNVGRQTAQKDLKTLLSAWRRFAPQHSGALLVLVGDGDERPMLETLVRDYGISPSVRFEGWRSNVADYLAAADAFASSSISEGTHIALGEAMAAGLPVIATPVGGARDFITSGENGFLVPVGGAEELAQRLAELAADPVLRQRLGRAAAHTAQTSLAQDETARQHLDALFGALSPTGAGGEIKSRIRVTYLIATLDRGGSEQQMAQLASRLDPGRFSARVLCLTRGGPAQAPLDAAGIPLRIFGKRGKVALVTLWRLVTELARHRPHVLHTWLFTSNLYGRIAAALARVPHVIISERSTDPWKKSTHRFVDRLLASRTDAVVANSRSVEKSLVSAGIPQRLISVTPNSVDVARFAPQDRRKARKALSLEPEGPYMGYIGRLAFEKRPEVFVDAAKAVLSAMPAARAVLFGDGPLRAQLTAAAASLQDRIIFFGDCPQVELAHAACDCLVLTSAWEGFPNVVLEAMASARPVVAVRMSATEELIEDGVTGVLCNDSAAAVAEAVKGLLSDPARAEEIGRRARERVVGSYSVEGMVAAYENLYSQVVGRHSPGGTA